MKFTQALINKLTLPAGKSEASFSDELTPGLSVRLRAGRRPHYFMRYRAGGVQHRLDLGDTGKVPLSEARRLAGRSAVQIVEKVNPAEQRNKAAQSADVRFSSVVESYIEWLKANRKPATVEATERYLRDHFKSFHAFSLTGVDRGMVATSLKRIASDNGPISSNRARANLSAFYNWARGENLCETNPVEGTNKAKKEEVSRERVLTPSELKIIWSKLPPPNMDGGYGDILRLLILTGQRRDEIGGLPVSEFNRTERQLEFSGERTKNGLPHIVPLSDMALKILESTDMEDRTHVFGRYDNKFSGWSKAKAELDARIKLDAKNKVAHWTLHDFRRTASTVMNDELDVQDKHVEAVLNHASGTKKGVAGTYNRALYIVQKREALQKYADWVAKVVA